MDIHDNYNEINKLATKKDLIEYIDKRFVTGFIGGLSSIEEHLYDLFSEEEWKLYWPPLREEILNKSNAQKRLALKKLEEYDFTKIRKSDKNKEERNFNR